MLACEALVRVGASTPLAGQTGHLTLLCPLKTSPNAQLQENE